MGGFEFETKSIGFVQMMSSPMALTPSKYDPYYFEYVEYVEYVEQHEELLYSFTLLLSSVSTSISQTNEYSQFLCHVMVSNLSNSIPFQRYGEHNCMSV